MKSMTGRARARRRGSGPAPLWLVSDPVRLPDPCAAAARLPRGAGVLARGLAPAVLARLAVLARRRGLSLLLAGDGRAALAVGAGLHMPDRRPTRGVLPVLAARRRCPGRILLSLAVHGADRAGRIRRLRPDLVFLSPLFATRSHPGAPSLGPLRWAAIARGLGVPAIALGGVTARTMRRVPRQAAGFAAIDGLAPESVAHPPQCLS